MQTIQGLEWTFDTVASTYEKFRPSYTDELYRMIFDYILLNESCHAVEVGIGGGQATLPILKTGCIMAARLQSMIPSICNLRENHKFKFFNRVSQHENRLKYSGSTIIL